MKGIQGKDYEEPKMASSFEQDDAFSAGFSRATNVASRQCEDVLGSWYMVAMPTPCSASMIAEK